MHLKVLEKQKQSNPKLVKTKKQETWAINNEQQTKRNKKGKLQNVGSLKRKTKLIYTYKTEREDAS
jgi:hypothetical protein